MKTRMIPVRDRWQNLPLKVREHRIHWLWSVGSALRQRINQVSGRHAGNDWIVADIAQVIRDPIDYVMAQGAELIGGKIEPVYGRSHVN